MDMYTDYEFQHLDITLATDCEENDLFQIVQYIRPHWKKAEVEIERIFGGFVNKTFSCLHRDDLNEQKDGLFVRVNSPNRKALSRILPMENEIKYIKAMNGHKIGAPLYATFNNGLVLKFMKGKMVTAEQLKNSELERKVAKILAQIHVISIPEGVSKCWTLKETTFRCLKELAKEPNLNPRYCVTKDTC